MKPLPMPRRLLDVFAPQHNPVNRSPFDRSIEPLLGLDTLPPPEPAALQPLPRRAIELELEEGSHRVYLPMAEEEVIERKRR